MERVHNAENWFTSGDLLLDEDFDTLEEEYLSHDVVVMTEPHAHTQENVL